jgi:hypothetical protein
LTNTKEAHGRKEDSNWDHLGFKARVIKLNMCVNIQEVSESFESRFALSTAYF